MLKSDIDNAREVCELIAYLLDNGKHFVQIRGASIRIMATDGWATVYRGEPLLDCLRAAKEDEAR